MILRLSFYLLITHVPILLRPPEKKKLKKTCKQPPTFSEIASFWTPLTPEFPLPSVSGRGERKFSGTTRYQKKTKYIASLICSVILSIYFHNLFSSSWWKITTHLTWSLLDLSEELTPLKSADYLSETLAHLLYAGYLVLALILLINMLIALLSNTYQRVQVRIKLLKGYFPAYLINLIILVS